MDELTRITHSGAGYTVTAIGEGVHATHERVLAQGVTRDEARTALWHRGFTPLGAVTALDIAARIGHFTVAARVAA